MKLYFVTASAFKSKEVPQYLQDSGVEVQIVNHEIQEILNLDLQMIVRDKALQAYRELGVPCAVEHGGLLIEALGGLPGGLSKVVWDTVGARICTFVAAGESRTATARSVIGYCDGQRVHIFVGDTRGTLATEARGGYDFQWDPVFIPNGTDKTYAELGFPEKMQFSQAAKAWDQCVQLLKGKQRKRYIAKAKPSTPRKPARKASARR